MFDYIRLHVESLIQATRDPSYVLPRFCFAGTKFSHVVASAAQAGWKNNLTYAYKGKLNKCKQNVNKSIPIPDKELSRLAGMKFDFPR